MRETIKRHAWQIFLGFIFVLMIVGGLKSVTLADVNVGDAIDSTNWQKVQGLVPDAVLDYLKKGWVNMKIGKLNYEPGDFWFTAEGLKRNHGKYDIAEDGELMVEKSTGAKSPMNIVAAPFPVQDLDPRDPRMPIKYFYNLYMAPISYGSVRAMATLGFFGAKNYERYIAGPQKTLDFIGSDLSNANQKDAEQFGGKDVTQVFIMRVTDPYELNGLATMTYGYLGNTPDKVFAYIPALRRVRTMTAAARSDSMFGTDYSLDDAGCGWWGKPMNFTFKYLRTQEALAQFADPDPLKFYPGSDGSINVQKFYTGPKLGYLTPGWNGKPWAVTNSIWVKRKVYVFEVNAKDPYYNYGKMEIWGDTKTARGYFKIINDRAGKRWKVMIMNSHGGYAINNYPWGFGLCARGDVIYDEQRDHATSIEEYRPGQLKNWNAKTSPDEFTLTGLAKLGK